MADNDTAQIIGVETADEEEATTAFSANGVTVNPDGTLTQQSDSTDTSGDGKSPAERVVTEPNGNPQSAAVLENQSQIEITHPLPPGKTLEVYRWGGYIVPDGSVPTGLTTRLLDGTDTVVASEETADNYDTSSPVASYENTGTSTEIVKLQVHNGTGSKIDTDGESVSGHFGFLEA